MKFSIIILPIALLTFCFSASFAMETPTQTATPTSRGQTKSSNRLSDMQIIAHRGVSAIAPENTMAAFKAALTHQADFVEFDIHLSKDDVPVVIHDPTTARTTNDASNRRVRDLTLSQLKELDAGSWFNPTFQNETVPTLQETLELLYSRCGVFIELKGDDAPPKLIAQQTAEVLKQFPAKKEGWVCVGSYSPEIIAELLKLNVEATVLGIADGLETLQSHIDLGVTHCVLDHSVATKAAIQNIHQKGATVWCFTVDDPVSAFQLGQTGIDGLISNAAHLFTLPGYASNE